MADQPTQPNHPGQGVPGGPQFTGAHQGPPPYYAPGPGYPPAPGYYGYAGRPTNTMAIIALVMAFVFAPLGIVFGIMAKRQIAQTGEDGEALATAGLWIGIVFTAILGLVIVAWIGMFILFVSTAATVADQVGTFTSTPLPTSTPFPG